MLATDLALALVRRGVPFRRAHHLVGTALKRAEVLGVDLQTLPHEEYTAIWYVCLISVKFPHLSVIFPKIATQVVPLIG